MIADNAPRVLIVEDDALLSITIEDILTDAGFQHTAVFSGDAAVLELERDASQFAAVLTDVRMPGAANGWQVGHRARELAPDMPVIYMSGDAGYLWSAHGVPNSLMLQKPFADAQLVTALATLINKYGQFSRSEQTGS